MRPASFIPHGMGRVSWNELEWNEFSQPKPLSFPPSIQQRLQLGAPPSAGSCSSGQSCPAPGGFHPVPTLGLTFVIRFWFSHLCYWAVLLTWNKSQKGDCGRMRASHYSPPALP